MKDKLTPISISDVIIQSEMNRATLYNRFGKYPKAIELMQKGIIAMRLIDDEVIESLMKKSMKGEQKC